jgi:hypothetical protein
VVSSTPPQTVTAATVRVVTDTVTAVVTASAPRADNLGVVTGFLLAREVDQYARQNLSPDLRPVGSLPAPDRLVLADPNNLRESFAHLIALTPGAVEETPTRRGTGDTGPSLLSQILDRLFSTLPPTPAPPSRPEGGTGQEEEEDIDPWQDDQVSLREVSGGQALGWQAWAEVLAGAGVFFLPQLERRRKGRVPVAPGLGKVIPVVNYPRQ